VDFMRMDPKGEFYLHRLLEDDFTDKVERGKALDAILVTLRIAEAIAVGLSVVKAVGWPVDGTKLAFGFRWTKLSGRELTSWARPMTGILPNHFAVDDSAENFVELPLDTPASVCFSPRSMKILYGESYRRPGALSGSFGQAQAGGYRALWCSAEPSKACAKDMAQELRDDAESEPGRCQNAVGDSC
jgi:hypothetical protein